MDKISKIAGNKISEYLLRRREEIRPGDNDNQQSIRTGIPHGILHRMYRAKKAWQQAIYLMVICGDIGIDMVTALTQKKYDRKDELNQWKERALKAEDELRKKNELIKKLND